MEGHGIKIIGRKQTQTMNTIVEEIYRRGANTSINLTKGQRLNCTGVQGLIRGSRNPCYRECILQQRRSHI